MAPSGTRVVFMGTPEFAVPSLDILVRNQYPIPAVVTAPDKPRGRGQELSPTPVKVRAAQAGIPVLQPEQLNEPGFVARLRELAPDLIVVVAFRILPREVFTVPRLGSFNLHASLLPKFRGAAPINWAIINGEKETGVTTFLLEEKVDTGGILVQRSIPIGPDENAGTLHDRLAVIGSEVVLETVKRLEEGKIEVIRQDSGLATKAPKIFKDDCRIVWDKPAERVRDFIRGLSPYPAAFTVHGARRSAIVPIANSSVPTGTVGGQGVTRPSGSPTALAGGKVLKIYRTEVLERPADGPPGEVRVEGEELTVATADKQLRLIELQQEGRRRMTAAEFLRGYPIRSGEKLT